MIRLLVTPIILAHTRTELVFSWTDLTLSVVLIGLSTCIFTPRADHPANDVFELVEVLVPSQLLLLVILDSSVIVVMP